MPSVEEGLILKNQRAGEDLYEMDIVAPRIIRESQPGQFIQVRVGESHDPLLRRPISIYDVNLDRGTLSLLYRVVGSGTRLLTGYRAGDYLDVMGPLGKGFTLPAKAERSLLIGGGVGMAPLLFLGRALRARNCQVTVLSGAGTVQQLAPVERFERLGMSCLIATNDGSAGTKGLVTDLLDNPLGPIDRLYGCGPEPMMAAAASWAREHSIWGEVSLEEHMACGIGACLGCARRIRINDPGYVKICKDGPVFNIDAIELYKEQQ